MRGPKEKACLLRGTESCAMVGSAWVDQGQAGSLARAGRVFTGQSLVRTGAGPGCWWGGLAQVSGDVARGRVCPVFPARLGEWGYVPLGEPGEIYPGICFLEVPNTVVPGVGLESLLFALRGAYQSNRKHIGSQT